MNLKVENSENRLIIQLYGLLDTYASRELQSKLMHLVQEKAPDIVLDLKKIDYVDSQGIATLFKSMNYVRTYNKSLKIINCRPIICRIMRESGLEMTLAY